ncbi:Lrp/AsnC family transcriptional regulator [Aestuariispira ectoiniformans]|uniref:Lrp/AsnC family transcriptional regulator n=1 Tax=Aestuariispira ectoiniformans TaxID=2775080 RepID=UPI00223AF7B0|nr:Lrp/AsnC family transcriptional regulator [Aestuariispira ectoiniformans]
MRKIALDAADIRILSAVQQNGQLSKTRLSELVNLSATPCWARFNRLKNAGLIRGYHGEIALNKITDFVTVIVTVSLKEHRKSDFDRFENHIRQLDQIVECIATGGGMDYVLKVVSPNLSVFQDVMDDLLAEEFQIARYMTYIVTREIKSAQPNLARLVADPEN